MRSVSLATISFTFALTTIAATGCVGTDDADTDSYLFGLTAEEVLDARRVANTDMTDAAWLEAHSGDFDCARYGDLCGAIGRDAAYDVIELGYRLALDGASRDDIRVAQSDAIEQARAARADEPEVAFYSSNVGFFNGGSNNHRLKITAHATEMWPSLELRAWGECITQRNSFGWLPAASDHIEGTMTATWTNLPVLVVNRSADDVNSIFFGQTQHDANHLTVTVDCSAREEGWRASGRVSVNI